MAVIVFLIWKFEPSVPFLVVMIATKDMKCASFPNLTLSTLLALMNVSVTFNAHLSLSDTFAFVSPSFLYFAIWFTYLCLHFVLMKSIWLAFILSRDVFVLTRIKTRVVFPWPPLRAFARNVEFCFIVSGSERTFTFHVSFNTLPKLATLVRDMSLWDIFGQAWIGLRIESRGKYIPCTFHNYYFGQKIS